MAYTASEGNVSAYLGPFIYKSGFSGSDSGAKAPAQQLGAGLIVLGDINKVASLELSFLFFDKIYFREEQGKFIAEETKLTHITMGYRRWFNEYFSGSLGFYSGYSMGEPTILHSDFAPGTEIDTSARDTTEYGFDLALQSELWSSDRLAVVADARYSFSVTNKPNEKGDHYGVLVGIQYQLQDKNPNDNLDKNDQ